MSVYIPTNNAGSSLFSTSSIAFILCGFFFFFHDGYSDWCEVIPHCNFDLHFSNNGWCWASFHVFIDHLYVFFGEMSVYVFCPFLIELFVFLIFSYMRYLFIFEINPLSLASFAIICSNSEGCLFILCIVSFPVQKLLSLIKSHLFIFVFISINLGGGSEGIFLSIYSSKNKSESHSVTSNCLQLHELYSSWNSPGQNTGVGSLSLLQDIFPTQGLNPGLLHCRQILYQLSQQGKPKNTGVDSLSLLQQIFLIQKLNWGLLHCRWILYQLSYQGRAI